MSGIKHDHALRKASQKYLAKADQSTRGFQAGTPKFFKQTGKASTVPKSKK